jgi:hypothetical protein
MAGVMLLIMVIIGVGGYHHLHHKLNFTALVTDFYANISTELASIVITVVVIDGLNRRRATEREKATLILQLGSPNHGFAVEAARMLRVRGWLSDGALRKVNLFGTDLQGAILGDADLRTAFLVQANLQAVDLREADLAGAYLGEANLREANLQNANLQETKLVAADFQGATLRGANLSGAKLGGANLEGTDLRGALFDGDTVLPDKTRWTETTDIGRFTDPNHPEFWRP